MSRRIYIDARNITASPAGVGRYAQSLIPRMVELSPDDRFVIVRHDSNHDPILPEPNPRLEEVFVPHHIGKPADFALGAPWLHEVFRAHGHPSVYHNLFHVTPLGLSRLGAYAPRTVVTLHDLIWIDHPLASQGSPLKAAAMYAYARSAIPASLARADHVICISEPTARRASRWLRPGHHTTIPHGVERRYFQPYDLPQTPALASLLGRGTPYVIAVGNDKPYKNLSLLLRAFARDDVPSGAHLVLVGSCSRLDALIRELGLSSRVHLTGFLSADELCRALSHATAFCFPSLVEGFGLPPLEAMALGTPALVSDLEPMRSVAGTAALSFDPHDHVTLARLLRGVLTDADLRADLRARGHARAKTFTWAKTAQRTLDVYDEVTLG